MPDALPFARGSQGIPCESRAMFALAHVAFPCFDVSATVRFYMDVLGGGALRHARSGSAEAWNAKEDRLFVESWLASAGGGSSHA